MKVIRLPSSRPVVHTSRAPKRPAQFRRLPAPRSKSHERNAYSLQRLPSVEQAIEALNLDKRSSLCAACDPALETSFHGHQSAVLQLQLLKDEGGVQEFATSSLDKTMKFWRIERNDVGDVVISLQTVEEGPVFALARDTYNQDRPPSLFCGTAKKDIVIWEAPAPKIVDRQKVSMSMHSGWVRAIAVEDRYLFSCGCNHLMQWDLAWPMPRVVGDIELYTGDIQCILTLPSRVYAACSNGSLRAWAVEKNGYMATKGEVLEAHNGRILSLAHHEGLLYSTGSDGAIKAWDAETLQLQKVVDNAHGGEKINCSVVSNEGVLYTGGNDCRIRAFQLPLFEPCATPIQEHEGGVRALAASADHLFSADSTGKIALWKLKSEEPCVLQDTD